MKDFNIEKLSWPLPIPKYIQVKVSTCSKGGSTWLLYKDARCDQEILDHVVGPENWNRTHMAIKDNIYCGVGIWDNNKEEWVVKWDAGSESFAEKEKGEASDSFKRANFNWGIYRELYSSPFIRIKSDMIPTKEVSSGGKSHWTLEDRYTKLRVSNISFNEDREIDGLLLEMEKDFKWVEVFRYPRSYTGVPTTTLHEEISEGSVEGLVPEEKLPPKPAAKAPAKKSSSPPIGKFPMCEFTSSFPSASMTDPQLNEILGYDLEHQIIALEWWKSHYPDLKVSYARLNQISASIKALQDAGGSAPTGNSEPPEQEYEQEEDMQDLPF